MVDDKITACVKQVCVLGVICKVLTGKRKKKIKSCASSNLLFLYELLMGPQPTFLECTVISCNLIDQLCLSGPDYSSRIVTVPLA